MAHRARLELASTISEGLCSCCGAEVPPEQMRIHCASRRRNGAARWTWMRRLWQAYLRGEHVQALCRTCVGRMFNARLRTME